MNGVPRFGKVGRVAAMLAAVGLMVMGRAAFAWNQPGHMLTASIAYDQLTPEQRARVLKVLEANPDYAKWVETAPKDVPSVDLGRFVFMQAARWPDDIRAPRKDEPERPLSPYDHRLWHYVDYPLLPPDFPMEGPPTGTEDLFSAYAYCEKMVTAPDTSPTDRAAYLCWLLHLTGDIQQPLHAATLINETYPKPDGDRGGNSFFVNLGGNPVNLHTYWDAMGAVMMDVPEIAERATNLEKKYPRADLPELATGKDVQAWALESRQLCIDVLYRRGTLQGSNKPLPVLPPLPGDYASKGRALAERRLALAGYRMANLLVRLKL